MADEHETFRFSLPGSSAGKSKRSRMVGRTTKERGQDHQKVDHTVLCWPWCTQRQAKIPEQMIGEN